VSKGCFSVRARSLAREVFASIRPRSPPRAARGLRVLLASLIFFAPSGACGGLPMTKEMNRSRRTELRLEPRNCPFHQGWPKSCASSGCAIWAETLLLEHRLEAIEWLVGETKECLLDNCCEVAPGVSLPAALETARVLVRSITRDPDLMEPGDTRVRWTALSRVVGRSSIPGGRDAAGPHPVPTDSRKE